MTRKLLPTTDQRRNTLRAIDRAERAMLPHGIYEDLQHVESSAVAQQALQRNQRTTTVNPHRQHADVAGITRSDERLKSIALAVVLGIMIGLSLVAWWST